MRGKLIVADLAEFDSHPPFDTDVREPVVDSGKARNQGR